MVAKGYGQVRCDTKWGTGAEAGAQVGDYPFETSTTQLIDWVTCSQNSFLATMVGCQGVRKV